MFDKVIRFYPIFDISKQKQPIMKIKNQKSKYRFYQSKSYIDKNGIKYSYDYKYMGVFHFFVLNANYTRAFLHEYELDELQLEENKN